MVTTGLATCGSVHACPVCSAVICRERASELVRVVESHRKRGCTAYLVTLTGPHERRDELAGLHRAITRSWRAVWGGKHAKQAIKSLGIEGYARATEVTYGERAGWHPHLHAIFVSRFELCAELTPDEVAGMRACDLEAVLVLRELRSLKRTPGDRTRAKELRDKLRELETAVSALNRAPVAPQSIEGLHVWLWRRWSRGAKRFGLSPSIDAGVHVQRADKAATYLAKMGLAAELVGASGKGGRGAHRTPWQLLREAKHRRRYRGLWQEFVEATWRTRQLTWSRAIRRRSGLLLERDDEAIAADAGRAIGRTLVLDKRAFDGWLRWRPGARLALEAAMSVGDMDAVCDVLADAKGQWWITEPNTPIDVVDHSRKPGPTSGHDDWKRAGGLTVAEFEELHGVRQNMSDSLDGGRTLVYDRHYVEAHGASLGESGAGGQIGD